MLIPFDRSTGVADRPTGGFPVFYTRLNPIIGMIEDVRFDLATGQLTVMKDISFQTLVKLVSTPQYKAFKAGEQMGLGVTALGVYGNKGPHQCADFLRQFYDNLMNKGVVSDGCEHGD